MARLAAAQPARGVHVEVARSRVAMGAGERHQQQQRIHAIGVPQALHHAQRFLRPVDPEIVAVDDQERVGIEHRRRLHHASARFHQLLALI